VDPARGPLAARLAARRAARVRSGSQMKPAIVQDAATGRVLMLAWMDDEAERLTRETGEAWFWSRSRERLWKKGETSGNTLAVDESDERVVEEAADLVYHLYVLLAARGLDVAAVEDELRSRSARRASPTPPPG